MLSPETGPVVQSCSADTRKGEQTCGKVSCWGYSRSFAAYCRCLDSGSELPPGLSGHLCSMACTQPNWDRLPCAPGRPEPSLVGSRFAGVPCSLSAGQAPGACPHLGSQRPCAHAPATCCGARELPQQLCSSCSFQLSLSTVQHTGSGACHALCTTSAHGSRDVTQQQRRLHLPGTAGSLLSGSLVLLGTAGQLTAPLAACCGVTHCQA